MNTCPNCKSREKQKHRNSKWCRPCADGFRARPRHTLTPEQIREVKKRLHKMPKAQIAEEVGISWSSLGRWARDEGVRVAYFNRWSANPKLVNQICAFYAKHGRAETEKRFPKVRVRSVIERYPHEYRQIRWTEDQLKELARMAGVISTRAQAKYFNRPRANSGSIKSAWMKRFGHGGGAMNGPAWFMARQFVNGRCRPIKTRFWSRRKGSRGHGGRKVVLWTDIERHLRRDAPDWLRDTAKAMARFQRWLHGTDDVRAAVKRMIKEREL